MVPVPQCTTGRVLMLQFKSSSQKLFYWLQERKTDRDEVILYQVNSLIQQSAEDDEADDIHMDEDVAMEIEGNSSGQKEKKRWHSEPVIESLVFFVFFYNCVYRNTSCAYCTFSSLCTSQPWLIIFRRRSPDFTTDGSASSRPCWYSGSSYVTPPPLQPLSG